MDNKNDKSADPRPPIKKLVLPLTFLVGGLLIFVILYKFLLGNKFSLPTSSEVGQESFQAPAEISTSLQIECQSSVEKIDKMKSCEEKESEFFSKVLNCANYSFVLENPTSLSIEGGYADILFNVASCYKGAEKVEQALAVLKKGQDFPAWQVDRGPVTCESTSMIAAYNELYSRTSNYQCLKSSDLENVVSQLKTGDISVLSQMVSPDHMLYAGIANSDVFCPTTFKVISDSLKKSLSGSSKVSLNSSEQKTENTDTYIEINKDENKGTLLKLVANPDGCLYLDSLLATTVDAVE
jgi:hypothetical protein